MHITVSGHHLDLTDALRAYVLEKMERVERHCDNAATNAHVILSVEKLEHKAEATLHIAGLDVHADSISHDMYAAIDTMVDKVDRQVRRHRDKRVDKHRGRESSRLLSVTLKKHNPHGNNRTDQPRTCDLRCAGQQQKAGARAARRFTRQRPIGTELPGNFRQSDWPRTLGQHRSRTRCRPAPRAFGAKQNSAGALFIKLADGVDFDAIDRQPVHLIFALLVPEHFTDEHLKILAYLAEMFSDQTFCDALTEAQDNDAVHRLIIDWKP